MKHLVTLVSAVILLIGTTGVSAQSGNVELSKSQQRELNRTIKKEAKSLKRDNYQVEPGAPALEYQLRRSYEKEFAENQNGSPRFLIVSGTAIGGIENAAKMHAVSDATLHACAMLESRILGLIEQDYNNKHYSKSEYETLSQMKGVFSNLLVKELPQATPVIILRKETKDYYEYQVRVAFPIEDLIELAKKAIPKALGQENAALREKMERITNFQGLGK
jgi:hypothetical protein